MKMEHGQAWLMNSLLGQRRIGVMEKELTQWRPTERHLSQAPGCFSHISFAAMHHCGYGVPGNNLAFRPYKPIAIFHTLITMYAYSASMFLCNAISFIKCSHIVTARSD